MNLMPPTDKAAHFGAGWIIAHIAALFIAWPLAASVAIVVGVAKEYAYDARTGGDVDPWDAIATALGAAGCALVLFLTSTHP